jgi:RNA polymerase sigma-70 factor (ECF subfamily)
MRSLILAPAPSTEQDLIERAMLRDSNAIRMITTQHNRRLYRIARSILRNDDEAEDAVQAGYLRAFSALANFRQESSNSFVDAGSPDGSRGKVEQLVRC